MRRTSFDQMQCPIARGLEHVGEWWSILILRDAFKGARRFDEFRDSLGIAPAMLTKRLATLVEAGFLARERYSEHPPRDEYVLTERGRDFRLDPPLAHIIELLNDAPGKLVRQPGHVQLGEPGHHPRQQPGLAKV